MSEISSSCQELRITSPLTGSILTLYKDLTLSPPSKTVYLCAQGIWVELNSQGFQYAIVWQISLFYT